MTRHILKVKNQYETLGIPNSQKQCRDIRKIRDSTHRKSKIVLTRKNQASTVIMFYKLYSVKGFGGGKWIYHKEVRQWVVESPS